MQKSRKPKTFEKLMPWLVKASDLRRYLGRALDRCEQGGTVFFYHTSRTGPEKGLRHLFALIPFGIDEDSRRSIFARFHVGRYKAVKLEAIKPRRGRAAPQK